ncbi:MAG: uracil-xanthine permease family protein [Microcystaceae cyanobacterium]
MSYSVEDEVKADNSITATTYQFRLSDWIFGLQILFVAFGALVLVPILAGLDPNVALLTAGLGTLIFQITTRGKVPVFLASSFAFIAPISSGIEQYGLGETLSGLVAAGLFYLILSLMIARWGVSIIERFLPPIVTGPVIMVIGLSLAPVAVDMMSKPSDNYTTFMAMGVGLSALVTTILTTILTQGIWRLLPILMGVIVGYLVALPLGIVDFSPLLTAPWFAIPSFTVPKFHLRAILFILPVAIAPAIEHIGDILAISSVTKQDFLKNPGLNRTLLGDGLATSMAAMLGGPPNTTYSEVTGAVALTRLFNPAIMTWASIFAIVLSFSGKLGGFLQTIPVPVMGGILVILFGTIVVVGMQSLLTQGDDLLNPRNLAVIAVILVLGVGGLNFKAGDFALQGIGLSSLMGILFNLLLPRDSVNS